MADQDQMNHPSYIHITERSQPASSIPHTQLTHTWNQASVWKEPHALIESGPFLQDLSLAFHSCGYPLSDITWLKLPVDLPDGNLVLLVTIGYDENELLIDRQRLSAALSDQGLDEGGYTLSHQNLTGGQIVTIHFYR